MATTTVHNTSYHSVQKVETAIGYGKVRRRFIVRDVHGSVVGYEHATLQKAIDAISAIETPHWIYQTWGHKV